MCVTNTTHRRVQAVSLTPGLAPSVLSQRLLGTFPTAQKHVVFPSQKQQQQPQQQQQQQQHQVGVPTQITTTAGGFTQHQQAEHVVTNIFGCPIPAEKPRPKRRRKPQKPGKTAKMNDRHFVKHNYHDHALDIDDGANYDEDGNRCDDSHLDHDSHTNDHHSGSGEHHDEGESGRRRRGGVAVAFPLKLHAVLDQVEQDGLAHVISWQPHGRCFVVHKPKEFVDHVMPKYFRQTKLTSFQRQLNLYGFSRLTRGADSGGYYHELFLRGKEFLCKRMNRTKVKGTKFKAASSPDSEPDFYTMPPVVVTPHHSSDEEGSFDSHPLKQQQPMYMQQQPQVVQEPVAPVAMAPVAQSPPMQSISFGYQQPSQSTYGANNNNNNSTYSPLQTAPPPLQSASQQMIQPPALPKQFQQPQQSAAFAQFVAQSQMDQYAAAMAMGSANAGYAASGCGGAFKGMGASNTFPALASFMPHGGDRVLDEALDELFLNDINSGDQDNLAEFVNDWDPANSFGEVLNDDAQLGFMLDKLLED